MSCRRRIPIALEGKIREQARFRCGYCLTSENLIGMKLEFEHLTPFAADGKTGEENLWLACRRRNEFKDTQTHALDAETLQNVALSTREMINGTSIFDGARTERRSSVFRQSDAPPASR